MRVSRARFDVSGSPPRAWGQRLLRVNATYLMFGSPPRAWGQRRYQRDARAKHAVHPHGRGDN